MNTLKLALTADLVTLCCGVILTAVCGWQVNPTMIKRVKTVARLMEENGMIKNALYTSDGPAKKSEYVYRYIFHDIFLFIYFK